MWKPIQSVAQAYQSSQTRVRHTQLVMVPIKRVERSQPSPSSQQSLGTVPAEPTGIRSDDRTSKRSELQHLSDDLGVLFPVGVRVSQPITIMSPATEVRYRCFSTNDDDDATILNPTHARGTHVPLKDERAMMNGLSFGFLAIRASLVTSPCIAP
jgi:hypothetical protein